eukprot:12977558-Ditylum_brightwellii.AAC.1
MESRNCNNLLWMRNPQLCNNSTIAVGTIFWILCPLPVKNLISGDVPMVETCFPLVVMRFSETALPAVRIDHSFRGNTATAFVQEDVTLQIHGTTPEETKCP